MNTHTALELYELSQEFLPDKAKAQAFVRALQSHMEAMIQERNAPLASKRDLATLETKINRSIYLVGLVQFLAIVGSVLVIVRFML